MTPKEKAEELIEKFASLYCNFNGYQCDKQCALITVDEILNNDEYLYLGEKKSTEYWQQVKTEIENL